MELPDKIHYALWWYIIRPFLAIAMVLTVSNWCGYTHIPWCFILALPMYGPFIVAWALLIYTFFELL